MNEKDQNSMKKAMVIDGNSMFYRMYFATKNQMEHAIQNKWTPNNAIKLMTNQILKFVEGNKYTYYFVAFDASKATFRHDELDSYKEKRDKTPDELIKQMNAFTKLLSALGIYNEARDKIEADDLVGSFVKRMNEEHIFVDVFSSDKDLLQLVNPLCDVHLMKTGLSVLDIFTESNFSHKFNQLCPHQIIDYKAIIGDQSDCLPGIKGVGQKTGITLLNKYGTLDNIYNHLDELTDNLKQKFIDHKDKAYQCYRLATILTDQYDNVPINQFAIQKPNYDLAEQIADEYKLANLINFINYKKLTGE